ncbi:flavin-binding monooxygenase [Coccidioides immitis RS]|uniref:Flavin-binding monooxygenase n=4 Tax=Coccidioides immitis TaxID=5501 RepID=J3KID0_COCIM|nr:flavin-binding monooxygenase [Coccidioides immitis RS]EAS35716.3 flavin-binding monooxygenase [Coccidioides immitis RS]KMP01003.1 FAD-dependent oxidoreductase [Coccidioides immitis RMSCC 2394]KMU83508.1 monooxygenase [Coccidioides immitis H538.4]TPX26061.1 hypothetical protein DIZ76_011520 [Coccidioides immitis]
MDKSDTTADGSSAAYTDFVVVGAGISGINFAYRIQTTCPSLSYTILESRNTIGGTWDLFNYPGIRSDSDLYTFGFSWYPWTEDCAIADAPSIRRYLEKATRSADIDSHIRFHHKVLSASWKDENADWRLEVEHEGIIKHFRCRYLIFGTGYYDYEHPLAADIPQLDHFKGTVVHPQFWPADLDYSDRKMVIIGSGATAVTLLPNLVEKASHVTMLQRSPSYVLAANNRSSPLLKRLVPRALLFPLLRSYFLAVSFTLFQFCQAFPNLAKRLIKSVTEKCLPPSIPHNPHFKPHYKPWDQRLCLAPDGDFFEGLRSGKASVATGTIKGFTDKSIILDSGDTIDDVDIVVTATGLKLLLVGNIKVTVNGQPLDPSKKFVWRSCMLQDVPNSCLIVGYTNASWTLGADSTAVLFCRIVQKMLKTRSTSVRPFLNTSMEPVPLLNLSSTYITKLANTLPKAGNKGPWKPRINYYVDYCISRWGSLKDGLVFS